MMQIPDDDVKRGGNAKLQEELFQASAKDQERKKTKQSSQKASQKVSQIKASNQLNNFDMNNENDKSKMIEQLMEMSILTKQTKGNKINLD